MRVALVIMGLVVIVGSWVWFFTGWTPALLVVMVVAGLAVGLLVSNFDEEEDER